MGEEVGAPSNAQCNASILNLTAQTTIGMEIQALTINPSVPKV